MIYKINETKLHLMVEKSDDNPEYFLLEYYVVDVVNLKEMVKSNTNKLLSENSGHNSGNKQKTDRHRVQNKWWRCRDDGHSLHILISVR